jgi:hypothetical protein
MKTSKFIYLIVIIFYFSSCETVKKESYQEEKTAKEIREFYQLKIFSFSTTVQIQTTEDYLQNAYIPQIKKLGIHNIGVFKPKSIATDSIKKIFVLIPFTSIDHFFSLDQKLSMDETYVMNSADFFNASHENIPYNRYESILLKSFKDFPTLKTPSFESERSERIYELRSYESPTDNYFRNKVEMFNEGGEIKLFDHLEFNAVFYGEVISGPKMPNLMYMTTFSDQASRDKHWKAFVDSPEWKKMASLTKYQNNVSHIDITFLYPTHYSDY